jgi:hypothetical protein
VGVDAAGDEKLTARVKFARAAHLATDLNDRFTKNTDIRDGRLISCCDPSTANDEVKFRHLSLLVGVLPLDTADRMALLYATM